MKIECVGKEKVIVIIIAIALAIGHGLLIWKALTTSSERRGGKYEIMDFKTAFRIDSEYQAFANDWGFAGLAEIEQCQAGEPNGFFSLVDIELWRAAKERLAAEEPLVVKIEKFKAHWKGVN